MTFQGVFYRQKKDEYQGLWLAPGGKVEKNEAPLETAIREVNEETGLHISALELKAILSFPDQGDSPFGAEWHVFVFYTKTFSGTLMDSCAEGNPRWIPWNELLQLPMWEGDQLFTPHLFKPGCFCAKLEYHGNVLTGSKFRNPFSDEVYLSGTTVTA